ncbi:MAG: Phospholipase 4 precursor [Collimonas fungivorans]|uniref:phosphocholine-specific phospholipase C n=1 Tax=Collimonas fungivorans TaxID=158899 RepID=UPI0026F212CA|nr:phospholipase C, phosphocholine-specific [Collimonas fungivorans]MDB5766364.1 Phospholipase 4 precursor [Collimonas fungivorans]
MAHSSRRKFLKNSVAAMGASMLPPAVQQVLAAPAASGTLGSVAHVVILCQENRSFDHYFGTIKGARGFNDDHAATIQGTTRNVFSQADSTGALYTPWRLNSSTASAQWLSDVPHDLNTGTAAWNKGRNDKWIPNKGMNSHTYMTRNDIPYHYALADAFTLCDNYFCSARTSTNPNRLYLMSGTIDPQGAHGGPATTNGFTYGSLTWQTYPEALQAAGISWRTYQEVDNYDDNALAWFKQFQNLPTNSPLYINGVQTRVLADFQNDVMQDTLPAVSWIVAPAAKSEHPSGSPNVGVDYANQYLQALAANPAVWAKTVFIYTYDENGGFYDHVTTPTPPAGTANEFVSGVPIGLGSRVPTIVCSPWSRGGWVASEVFDHTSTIQFLEKWTGVTCPNISQWRRDICGDLTSCFDFSVSNTGFPVLPDTVALAALANTQKTLPKATPPAANTVMPPYEAGQKPLRVQPYQLNGWLTQDFAGQQVWTNWSNGGSKPAPLQINVDNYRSDNPWIYTMAANATSSDYWHVISYGGGYYDLEMIGPNQFYRRFKGYLSATAWQGQPEPQVKLSNNGVGQAVSILFDNSGTTNTAVFTVLDRITSGSLVTQTVTVAAKQTATLQLNTTGGWYDLKISLGGDSNFMQSMVGYTEGHQGLTRPPVLRW